ncbi:hypothetical protein L226DRAFT_569216 [Lentinus tigrinus ALCF2SS1-7]|uniref:uncharacterized protein n=1 Tax=Lentinus tigrinus ALCF2SS1-7 TaxID=1328758 RepID=UPI0011663068|nr:hypothetical protein L226DRAFT_569216 [Lentinus tigrinus ALCF2SS1-7]
MLSGPIVPFLFLATLLAPYAANAATISLFVPDAQDQSYAVEFLGTDATGHTTWAIGLAGASDTRTASFGIATMVAGPTDLHLVEDVSSALGGILHDDCGINGDVAVCTVVLSSSAGVRTAGVKTETVSAVPVQIATAPPAAPTSTTGSAGASLTVTGTASTASATAASSTPSGDVSGGSPSAQTVDGQQNGAVNNRVAGSALALAAVGIAFAVLF